ncbi:hypothetical protein NHX12_013187 [Muraenolepis orangiensis]|uniref:STAS domain-containing protein n=1 Tax=Muraenolepis orangiensis TaxID=630683 RepID=A0A9Q0I666_9TELE|nr:hypothetical protein NHX12_013187 [Muraenolepis orangiensis]
MSKINVKNTFKAGQDDSMQVSIALVVLIFQTGLDISTILTAKKKLEAKRKRHEQEEAKRAKKAARKNQELGEPEVEKEMEIATIEMKECVRDPSLPRAIVLDLSPVNFLDTVGVKTIRNIRRDYGDIGIDVVLSGCQSGVVDSLQRGGFFSGQVTKACLFSTNHDAVFGDPFLPSSPMPEPGDPRKTPQGVPFADLKHIVNADGLYLFCRYWEPDGPPSLCCAVNFAAAVGHGQSEGERMNIKDFQIYVRDSLQHVDLMKGLYPSLPVYIVGHSMGGAISILTACERPSDFAGVALIGPMIQMNPDSATPFKVFMAKMMNYLIPSLPLGTIQSKWISRDPKTVAAYDSDQLNFHGGVRVSFAMQLMAATTRIEREIPTIGWPFLLLHGDTDKLSDVQGSQLMMERAPSADKRLKQGS